MHFLDHQACHHSKGEVGITVKNNHHGNIDTVNRCPMQLVKAEHKWRGGHCGIFLMLYDWGSPKQGNLWVCVRAGGAPKNCKWLCGYLGCESKPQIEGFFLPEEEREQLEVCSSCRENHSTSAQQTAASSHYMETSQTKAWNLTIYMSNIAGFFFYCYWQVT